MPWYIFALLAAILDATYYMLVKKFLKDLDPYLLGAGAFLSAFILMFIASAFHGFPVLGPQFYYALIAHSILKIIAAVLYYRALSTTDLSLAMPMISFTPVFLIFTSYVLLHEQPSHIGILGILLIVFGSYILNLQSKTRSFLALFRSVFSNKGVLSMLLVAFIFSITSNYDKIIVLNSDAIFGTAIGYLLLGIALLFISGKKITQFPEVLKNNASKFVLFAIIIAAGAITYNHAIKLQIVPYVISIKRVGAPFSVIYGAWIFHEKNIAKRAIGALIMFCGVILILIFA